MDAAFSPDRDGLLQAVERLCEPASDAARLPLPGSFPERGIGELAALEGLAPLVIGEAMRLGSAMAFGYMDPPTPWVAWATTLWNAALNQNLLHPTTAPVARDLEARVVQWLAAPFGMAGGHLTPGSTLANLTALWAARDSAGCEEIAASAGAHLSIPKAARILGLRYRELPADITGRLIADEVPRDLSRTALVLTVGTTSAGAIDPLHLAGRAAWTHVDAAWAGPLQLTRYAPRLAGVERADSVAVSAHKWLFQPKESALVLFREPDRAHAAVSFEGAYLAAPNVGILGSHGAAAVPLLATLLAWGREGLAARIERCMALAEALADHVERSPRLQLLMPATTGVVVWRPIDAAQLDTVRRALPPGAVSVTTLGGERWLRNVAANPNADIGALIAAIEAALDGHESRTPVGA